MLLPSFINISILQVVDEEAMVVEEGMAAVDTTPTAVVDTEVVDTAADMAVVVMAVDMVAAMVDRTDTNPIEEPIIIDTVTNSNPSQLTIV